MAGHEGGIHKPFLALVAAIVVLVLVPGTSAAQVTYQEGDGKGSVSQTDDAKVHSSSPNNNYGATTDLWVDESGHEHSFVKFPNIFGGGVDQIPLGSWISSATLTMQVFGPGDNMLAYQLTEGWVESQVTWNDRSTGVGWTNSGADGTGSHKASADGTLSGSTGSRTVDVTASVQNWSNGELNEGWLLKDTGTDGTDLRSSEYATAAQRPLLTVTYTSNNPPTVAAAIPDTTVNEDNPTINNYRDLNAVFTDLQQGGALNFTIQSNTNPGLVTPTIGADSALDLSFVAEASGTATITIRATDAVLASVDDVFIVTVNAVNDQPTVVAAIPDTVVNQDDPPINNYRDLNAVFTDVEEGSALTFTIQSNTNAALVTPTIGADSALDLSFTASTSGTATITVRATDGGALFVDDVFTVTVLCPAATLPLSDSFTRANSSTVSNCWWEEYETGVADAIIRGNRLQFDGNNERQSPRVSHTFTEVSTGWLKWTYVFNWDRTGGEGTYELWMQLGNSATWVDPATSDNTGVAVNLKWASPTRGMTNHEGFGYVQGGTTTEVAVVSGGPSNDHTIEVFANLDLNTFTLKIDGVTQVAGVAFDNNVTIDGVRLYMDELGTGAFATREFDDMTVELHTNLAPTVAAAIPDTTVNEDNPTINNFRDLNAVFSDSEDDGALTFSIQSNTNPGLVTPTIGADSALDLSFVAEANGTATITIRAEDSGTLTVDDVFIVTVNAVNDQPTVVAAIPDTTVTKDAAPLDNYRDLNAVFDDVEEGSALTFTIENNTNPGLVTPTIGADSALDLSFTASTFGTATITIRATDGGPLFVDDVFTLTVNDPPTVASAIPDTTVNEDNPAIDNYRDLKAVFTDSEDGSGLTFSIQSNTNPGLVTPTIVAADSTLDLSFTAEASGTATITVRAADVWGATVDDVFTVTVNSVNDQPTVIAAIPDTTVIENNPTIDNYRDLNAVFNDVEDGSALTFTIQNNTNPGLVTPTIGADSALDLSFTASTFGASTITLRATDGGGLTVDDVFTVTVFQAQGIAVATDTCDMGQDGSAMDATGSIDLFASDDWGAFCFVNINIPQGATIESALFKIYAFDTSDDSPNVYIDFEQVDSATTLATTANNISLRWTETGNKVTWDANNIGTGQVSSPDLSVPLQAVIDRPGWKPGNSLMLILDQFNSTDLEITSIGENASKAARLDIQYTVVPNNAPTVASAIPDTTVVEDNALIDNYRDLNAVFTDPEDGGQLNFIIQSNTNPGLVTPTIVAADSTLDLSFTASTSGTATITIRATDSGALFVDDVFTVTVNATPTVASAIADTTVVEDAAPIDNYRDLKAVFTDVEDGSGLTYTIQSNTNSGLVTPTIVAADSTLDLSFTASTSGTATITIRATDSGASFVDDVFTVTVDGPPTVASAIADTTVSRDAAPIDNYRDLKAVFTDAEDGSALTYTIQSNTNSGLVTPTIVAADSTLDLSFTASTSGTATITIRATDSGSSFVDDVFTVTVNATPTVASAIPDTTVAMDAAPIDNYRDLKAVFTDVEDGSGLTYSIESNTNSGLVTPTIVAADSTLDLSFTASTTGTATITVRATDSGALFVEDVFTVTVGDQTPPDAVADLATGTVTTSSVQLSWTAPGDDGATGTATTYDVRYSTSTITAGNWASATQATGEPAPQVAGGSETFTVTGLSGSTTYYFAIKASDEVPNESTISNVPSATTPSSDATAPNAIADLATGTVTASSVALSWTAPGDDGATGTATTYDVRYSTSTITAGNWATATQASGEPAPQVAGSSETFTVTGLSASTTYYFAIKTSDEVPNESALSNVPSAATSDATMPNAIADLATGTVTASSVALSWTAPGDDGVTGTATTYDVRYSTSTITAGNWATATQASGEPAPQVAGSSETFTVTALSASTTYYFAIKTSDEVPNESALSNVPSAVTSDATAPNAIADLATGTVTASSVALSWTAPGDDGATGTATTYDVRYSTSMITAGNWATATQASGEPAPQVVGSSETFTVTGLSGSTTYYFAIKTSDEVPNESTISNVPSAATPSSDATAPDPVADLATGTMTTSSVALSWTASGDDGATGTATTYDVRYSTSTITAGKLGVSHAGDRRAGATGSG